MLPIQIVPQKREFGCSKAVIKTILKTKYGVEFKIKDPLLYFKSLGSLYFLGMANDALQEHKLPHRFIKKTHVKFHELEHWLSEEKLMIVLFISRENYPHYAIPAGTKYDSIFIANTHGAKIEEFTKEEFIERFYLNPRYIEHIQWRKGEEHPFMDRVVCWGMQLAKMLGFVKPGTVYVFT